MDDVRDSFRSSLGGWLRGTAAGLATVFVGIAGFATMIAVAGDWGAWPLVLTGLALVVILVKWLEVMGAKYEITPERLIVRRGIVFKSIDEVELYRIKDVRMDFSLLNQWAGIGTICLSSSDETTRTGDLVLRQVEKAQARREELRRLVDAARQRRGVREIDMVHEDI
ncbi:MAG TPA: PH domain-containing protein [Croceibacterium sp.]|nr:PH domain-containing protein [Croceibacterium sp.]